MIINIDEFMNISLIPSHLLFILKLKKRIASLITQNHFHNKYEINFPNFRIISVLFLFFRTKFNRKPKKVLVVFVHLINKSNELALIN